jgi:sugar/nucleoside kinase (ribokinase family)
MADRAVALGAHILDVHAKYVTEIPAGQGGTLIDEIRLSPAGAAGGTAVTLAKLGFDVVSAGAIGSDDLGDILTSSLGRFGVDTSRLARKDGVQTSATVLPIRPNGERPALHVIGANGSFELDDVPWDAIDGAAVLHVGGPEFLAEKAVEILGYARERGVITSADMLADGWPELLDMLDGAWEKVDWFFPNEEQAQALTGEEDTEAGARALIERGIGAVAVTCGAEGSLVVTADGAERVPAFEVEVVDTTGCGDAYVAGFLRGLSLGRSPVESARLGSAAAAFVAQGLGSDAGEFDLSAADSLATG